MASFNHKNGLLHAENVAISEIASSVDTPFYCYSTAVLKGNLEKFIDAFSELPVLVCYSVKANSNQAVLKTLADYGAGMDVVSMGELIRVKAVGVPGNKIVFSGVGKTADELSYALDEQILCFNVESESELQLLSEISTEKGLTANVSFRINPDVDALTHSKITTGKAENKFGISWRDAPQIFKMAGQLSGIKVTGIDMHIGSQITELAPFEAAFNRLAELVSVLRAEGHTIEHIDLGGGLGIAYDLMNAPPPDVKSYAEVVKKQLKQLGCRFLFEPGRYIVGDAGILVTKVIYTKRALEKTFIVVDAAMNDLIRPTLYDAHHEIVPVEAARLENESMNVDIVGPVCETGDYFARNREFVAVEQGDLLAVQSVGAYGAVQSCTYNTRLLIPEVLVNGSQFAIVRERTGYKELLELDTIPEWLSQS